MIKGNAILIPAAGSGSRLALGPKAWLHINQSALLSCLARKALSVADTVVIAVPKGGVGRAQAMCSGCVVIEGSDSRQQTIASMLASCEESTVVIHDAARPFVSAGLLKKVADIAATDGVAAAFLSLDVPVARIRDGRVIEQIPSSEAASFQAPQGFSRDLLEKAYDQCGGHKEYQSTLQMVMDLGADVVDSIRVVPGEKHNIKITTAEDWAFAQYLERYL